MTSSVSYELSDSVATIALDDGKVNVLGPAMQAAINDALDRAEADKAKAVVLAGNARVFSGGFDLAVFQSGDAAAALGIPVRRVQVLLVTCSALMTAVLVSLVGSIGFVGLVIPHAVRLLAGPRHTRLLPLSALCGALFLIAADVLSRTLLKGQVLPIGVITALVGAPVFALILIRGQRLR